MATVSIPSSRQARMTRTAISPRLATRTFLNSFCFMVLTALQRIAGHPRSVAMPLQVDEKGLRAFGPVGALAPRRPIFGLISCAPRSRIIQMRSLPCSEMRPNLDHLDGQLARRPFSSTCQCGASEHPLPEQRPIELAQAGFDQHLAADAHGRMYGGVDRQPLELGQCLG